MRKLLKLWILPLAISMSLFLVIRPILAQEGEMVPPPIQLDNSKVGTEAVNGFRQVYYLDGEEKKFITNNNYTSSNPVADGENVVWQSQIDSGWRIFLYHVPSGTTTQLTDFGINVNPKIDGNKVVWEGQDNGVWQVYLFDGIKVNQLTSGDMSLNPEIEGDFVVYGRKDLVGWRASIYSLLEKKEKDIIIGELAQKPNLVNGKIKLPKEGGGTEEFNLAPQDLFTLDLAPLAPVEAVVPETVTIEEILKELEAGPVATESAVIEELTPTPTTEILISPTPTLEVLPTVVVTIKPSVNPEVTP